MLSIEDNKLMTETDTGTPMGELFRRFWLPALMADELPSPDCAPVRLTILGERLIGFKDTSGRIGFLDQRCPHRHSNLFYGRNENNGLRCVYHGWKFDVDGNCTDIPNSPEGETYKDKIQAFSAYPATERGGLIWIYMGPKQSTPDFPEMEWARVPDSHRYISKMLIDGNYLQTAEGDIDSSHVGFLHSRLNTATIGSNSIQLGGVPRPQLTEDRAPTWTITDTEYGVMLAAHRDTSEGENYWRVNQWLMPSYTMIASQVGQTLQCNVRVPIDDEHTLYFRVKWHPDRPLTDTELNEYRNGGVIFPEIIPGTYLPIENASNDYLIDRAAQKMSTYTGIKSIPAQDFAVQSDMGGPIMDRSQEHLVSSDQAIIRVRKRLLDAARELLEGNEPVEAKNGQAYRVRSLDIVLPAKTTFEEGATEHLASKV